MALSQKGYGVRNNWIRNNRNRNSRSDLEARGTHIEAWPWISRPPSSDDGALQGPTRRRRIQ
eukprot:8638391-Pyramimonas_sp.AAC.1